MICLFAGTSVDVPSPISEYIFVDGVVIAGVGNSEDSLLEGIRHLM